MQQITLKIDGMMCGMCESHMNDEIRNAFNKLCHSTFSFYSYENHRL